MAKAKKFPFFPFISKTPSLRTPKQWDLTDFQARWQLFQRARDIHQ